MKFRHLMATVVVTAAMTGCGGGGNGDADTSTAPLIPEDTLLCVGNTGYFYVSWSNNSGAKGELRANDITFTTNENYLNGDISYQCTEQGNGGLDLSYECIGTPYGEGFPDVNITINEGTAIQWKVVPLDPSGSTVFGCEMVNNGGNLSFN